MYASKNDLFVLQCMRQIRSHSCQMHIETILFKVSKETEEITKVKTFNTTCQMKKDIRFPSFSSCLFIEFLQLCAISYRNERRDDRRLLLLAWSCNPVNSMFSHFPRLTLIAQGTSCEWRNEATVTLQQTLKSSDCADFQMLSKASLYHLILSEIRQQMNIVNKAF